jgi:cholesterol oxidase
MQNLSILQYDYVIIGSGFGGSVSALRLAEKGYKVLVIEKGKWHKNEDFPKSNWNLKRWLWMPCLGWYGIMKLTFLRHITILSGTGVGGGSLVYANTLPVPKDEFFKSGSWASLADWKSQLAPFYHLANKMLGAVPTPKLFKADLALQELANKIGMAEEFEPTSVNVFFGEPGVTVPDPFFDGRGPERAGCTYCGGCMTGCRHNAKNSLDKNYLCLAQLEGATIMAEKNVVDVKPLSAADGSDGYRVKYISSSSWNKKQDSVTAKGVVFAGGVLGTVPLLLKLKQSSLPKLSEKVGYDIRTNNESLVPVTNISEKLNLHEGVAIGSILHTDKDSHLEPVRYSKGSGFWRWLMLPLVSGNNIWIRIFRIFKDILLHPGDNFRLIFIKDWARSTSVLLFMQHLDSTIRFSLNRFGWLSSSVAQSNKPSVFIPRAQELALKYSSLIEGKPTVFFLEPLAGIPSTAHILGGAVMGESPKEGVIDKNNCVFGYKNLLVCDGSAISANPGVNPSLSITAIAERAMSLIPGKKQPG